MALELPVEPGVLDRHHGVVAEDLEQLDHLSRRHQPVLGIVHREVSDQLAGAVEQRHQEDVVRVPLPVLARPEVGRVPARQVLVERVVMVDEVRAADLEVVLEPRQEVLDRDVRGLEGRAPCASMPANARALSRWVPGSRMRISTTRKPSEVLRVSASRSSIAPSSSSG